MSKALFIVIIVTCRQNERTSRAKYQPDTLQVISNYLCKHKLKIHYKRRKIPFSEVNVPTWMTI